MVRVQEKTLNRSSPGKGTGGGGDGEWEASKVRINLASVTRGPCEDL